MKWTMSDYTKFGIVDVIDGSGKLHKGMVTDITVDYRPFYENQVTLEVKLLDNECESLFLNKQKLVPDIEKVIFNNPATIVFWKDGSKTVVKCDDRDGYDPEKGLAMAISRKALGNKYEYYNTFKHWLKKYDGPEYNPPKQCIANITVPESKIDWVVMRALMKLNKGEKEVFHNG